jgi:phosphoribosylanthranilate isomerase
MIIKVCGLRHPENILHVVSSGADYIGLIFHPHSPRMPQPEDAQPLRRILQNLPCRKAGVFVNAPAPQMLETAALYHLDAIQLHGDEPPELCHNLRRQGITLIKALPIANEDDLKPAADYDGQTDYLLFDTRTPRRGGSGQSFPWNLLDAYHGATPFLLSGGIRPSSLEALQHFQHPRLAGVDLNSGFETKPGLKDAEQLRDFIHSLRTTQTN